MTGKEKLKLGLGLAASAGAGALASQILVPKVADMRGGRIMKILGFFGAIAVAGIAADAAGKQAEEMVETYSEVPGLIREIKNLRK